MVKYLDFVLKLFANVHVYYYFLQVRLGFPFRNVSIDISKFTGRYGIIIRRVYYKKTLKSCGDELVVHFGSYFCYKDIEVGYKVSIEENCVISKCEIGDFTIVSHRVSIMSGGNHHDVDDLTTLFIDSNMPLKKVKIGRNVWIGVHAVIMNDVSSGTVVAANSVVTKVFQENNIIGGVPAKIIRKRGASKNES